MGENSLQNLHFDNSYLRRLPEDTERKNYRRQVREACYSRVAPAPVSAPELLAFSKDGWFELYRQRLVI